MATNFTENQQKAIDFDSGNILVTASAGSGKTRVMIERAVNLVSNKKAKMSEILAVTFTDAAAKEMKLKLQEALAKKIQEGDKDLAGEFSEIATSDISTIHSFCAKIIRQYFYKVGLSPDFSVADESISASIKSESMEETFKEFYDSKEEWFKVFCDRFRTGRSDKWLKEKLLKVYEFCETEANFDKPLDNYINVYSEKGYEKIKSEYKKLIDEKISGLIDRTYSVLARSKELEFLDCVSLLEDLLSVLKAVLNSDLYAIKKLIPFKRDLSFKRGLDGEFLELKTKAVEIRDELSEYLNKKLVKYINSEGEDKESIKKLFRESEELSIIVKRFREIYSQKKREENLLDFGDLEHFTLNILEDESVRDSISGKYKYVFVDEFQDVNDIQNVILNKVSNNNLFAVGDEKQSIYGFRGSGTVFDAKKREMEKSGETMITLNDNFRCSSSVVNAVNDIFSFCMTDGFFAENYKDKAKLIYGKTYPENYNGRVKLHWLENSTRKNGNELETPRIYDVYEEFKKPVIDEASTASLLITKIINEECLKTYYNPIEKKEVPITLSDIAILARGIDNDYVKGIVDGLIRHGISVESDVEQNLLDYPEVIALVNLLQLIDCFEQDIPLVSVLKSDIGDLSEEDLAEIALFYKDERKREDRFFDAFTYYIENADTELKNKLVKFTDYFNGLRKYADFFGAYNTLKKIMDDFDYLNYLSCKRTGEYKVSRVERFLSFAKSNGSSLSVRDFLKKIKNCKDAFTVNTLSGEDAVKVMTIHGSKGLEFPVVIVCGLERQFNRRDEAESILEDREYGFALKEYDDKERVAKETLLRGFFKERLRKEQIKEEMRLFYVALTRARDSLHMIFEGKEDKRSSEFYGAGCFYNYIPDTFPCTNITPDELKIEKGREDNIGFVLVGKSDEKKVNEIKRNLSFSYKYKEDTKLPLKSSVTKSISVNTEDKTFVYTLFNEQDETGAERGTIAHRILENFDFSSSDSLDEQIENMILGGVLLEEEVEKIDLDRLTRVLKNDVFNKIKDCRLFREKSFIVSIKASEILDIKTDENILLQGIIDLLAIDNENAYILDYKYSVLSDERLEKKYKKQLDLYAYAVENVLKCNVKKKALINLYSGSVIELD